MIFNSEDFGAWRRGDEPYGSFTQSSEQKHSGSYAGKLSYDFPAVQNNYVVFLRPAPLRIPEQPDALTLWVFGDGSNHFLNAWIRDAQGEVRQFTFGQVSHKDQWQPMMLRLDTTAPWPQGHISGPDNGRLDFPISLEALVLDGVPDGAASKGVLYLDDLMSGQRSGANLPAAAPGRAAASVAAAARPSGLALRAVGIRIQGVHSIEELLERVASADAAYGSNLQASVQGGECQARASGARLIDVTASRRSLFAFA